MNAIEKLIAKAKEQFNAPVVPVQLAPMPPAPAPAAPVPPAAVPGANIQTYTTEDGIQVTIAQAGPIPAIGDVVSVNGVAAPAGVIELMDSSELTVDANGVITAIAMDAPLTTDLSAAPIAPTVEERIAALENKIAQAKMSKEEKPVVVVEPKPAVVKPEPIVTKEAFDKALETIAKHESVINSLLTIVEAYGGIASAQPATMSDAVKDRFERKAVKDSKQARFAEAMSQIKVLN